MSTELVKGHRICAIASIERFSSRKQDQLWQEAHDARVNHVDRLKSMAKKGTSHNLWQIAELVAATLDVTEATGVPVMSLPLETRQVLIAAHYAGMLTEHRLGLLQWDGADFVSLLRQPEEQRVDLAALQAAQEYAAMQTIDAITGKI